MACHVVVFGMKKRACREVGVMLDLNAEPFDDNNIE